ncbi:MAG: 3'-5' exonuclease [Cyanobacteria bacterium P01_F01_bin.150]
MVNTSDARRKQNQQAIASETVQPANTVVVLDFETSGMSPKYGDRPIEVGAVLLENGQITDRFQKLMNPGFLVPSFIESYTGITNTMLSKAADCSEVMTEFAEFLGDRNLVAHNASFDRKFLDAEFQVIDHRYEGAFACSVLLSRRLNQDAPSHSLGRLVAYKGIPTDGVFHRALADAEMTAHLWLMMLREMEENYGVRSPSFKLMQQISKKSKASVHKFLTKKGGCFKTKQN